MTGSNPGSYLLATMEAGGVVAPFITVARKLLARGHSVRIMSDICNRNEIETAGADFVPWTTAPSRPARGREHELVDDWNMPTAFDGFRLLLERILVGRAADYAADIRAELTRKPADLVVANDMLLGVQMGCESVGQPFVLMACNVLPFPVVPGIPPMGPGLPPAVTPEDAALHDAVRSATFAVFDSYLPQYNAARAGFGLAPLERLVDQIHAGDRFLLATARAFDFAPARMPDFFEYVGPQLGDTIWSKPWVSPFAQDDTRPLVLVGFSTTYQNHAAVLQRTIDVLAELSVRAVVTLGGSIRPDEVSPGANTAIVESAPHNVVMKDAALVITHGGHGTVMKALVHGLPQLIIPHGRDQNDNAIRVTHRGAGLSLDASADVAALRAAIARLLDEPEFTRAAADFAGQIRAETNACCIVSRLEALATGPAASDARLSA
jgi:MGT family glycosyltransferase